MLFNIPGYIIVCFLLTVAITFFLFIRATRNKLVPSLVLLGWLILTGILAFKGVFENTAAVPPRLAMIMVPAFIFIVVLLGTKKGRSYADNIDLKGLTLVHVVRVPVELILFLLASRGFIPELMTFAGRNFDVVSGMTAPVVYFACFRKSQLTNRRLLLAWNFICLALLINIVVNAILSLPYAFQRFGFDHPNVAVLYFPFTWLPCFIVMIVLYSHLAAIRKLLKRR